MKQGSFFRTFIVLMMATVLLVAGTSMVFAATSARKITYKGSGKVVVSFKNSVTYEDVGVTVKDNSGKTYKTSIKSKDGSSITFVIKSYKTGKTYKITVDGIKSGTVTGSFKIYSKAAATSTAKAAAKKAWEIKSFKSVKATSSTYRGQSVWKIAFQSGDHSYTYMVAQQTGKIIYSERK